MAIVTITIRTSNHNTFHLQLNPHFYLPRAAQRFFPYHISNNPPHFFGCFGTFNTTPTWNWNCCINWNFTNCCYCSSFSLAFCWSWVLTHSFYSNDNYLQRADVTGVGMGTWRFILVQWVLSHQFADPSPPKHLVRSGLVVVFLLWGLHHHLQCCQQRVLRAEGQKTHF